MALKDILYLLKSEKYTIYCLILTCTIKVDKKAILYYKSHQINEVFNYLPLNLSMTCLLRELDLTEYTFVIKLLLVKQDFV